MDSVKHVQTNDSVDYTTDRQRPWNKCQLNHCLDYPYKFILTLTYPLV